MFDHLHQFHKESGHTIGRFVNDEQDQFVAHFQNAFEFLTKFHGETHPLAMISDISPVSTFNCPMEVRSSESSFGLQLVDVCTWIAKRVIEKHNQPQGKSAVLWEAILEHSFIKDYDFDMLVREVQAGADFLYSRDFTEEQLAEAKMTLVGIEENRKRRLVVSEAGKTNRNDEELGV